MIFLFDMDGVIVDYERGFIEQFKKAYPNVNPVPLEERKHFELYKDYPEEIHPLITNILQSQGFYRDLPPMVGAREALEEIVQNNDLFICSTPSMTNTDSAKEKYDWMREHYGQEWTKRLVLTYDKTMVHGDILVDDKPEIKGLMKPSWEQVLYTFPYNINVNKRRMTWDNWKEVLFSNI
jgi:5'-nucleotidase